MELPVISFGSNVLSNATSNEKASGKFLFNFGITSLKNVA